MQVIEVDDPDDPRIADYVRLTDVALRRRLEPATGLYIAESAEVIERALGAGHRPRSVLTAAKWLPQIEALLDSRHEPVDPPVYVAGAGVLRDLTGYRVHRGALAAMHRPELPSFATVIAHARRVVVLEDIVDHTNVGAIFRSAAALGADAVLISPRCADPLYRRSVRVSMGAVFQVPWTRLDPWPAGIADLRNAGFVVAALALDIAAVDLDRFAERHHERVALVLGAEGDGLSRVAIQEADALVRIPMSSGVDSLNVAAASAVALWALRAPRPAGTASG